MGAIGLNPIRLDAIGLDPIRFNAIKLGVPGASSAIDRPYISPDVLSALAGVWIADGKSNTDPDRNIIKNKLPGRGGDFEILNAAYKLNSGFGKYREDFTSWRVSKKPMTMEKTDSQVHISYIGTSYKTLPMFEYTNPKVINDYTLTVEITGIPNDCIGKFIHVNTYTQKVTNGINTIKFQNDAGWFGFTFYREDGSIIGDCNITIKQIPEYEGAFVTDGVNDMIVSQNPVSEMLGGSKELTVVSMIHQISPVPDSYGFTNYIREGSIWSRTNVKTSGKTGIYGYKISKGNTEVGASNLINNILGDKADYEAMGYNITNYSDINYSVAGYIKDGSPTEVSSVAWYWTFIAKRALTTDEINQVIAYYNLDKYVKPDIYYNVKKQGLTNDTPDEDWYLKDFSGNGRDMTLYNYARTPESGINEEGGLQSDGVDDYGQFVGDLGLKDYTVAVDRAYQDENVNCVPFISSVGRTGGAPFLMEMVHPTSHVTYPYSFGTPTESVVLNSSRQISYQSTYVYNRNSIARGNSVKTGDGLTIGSNEGVSQYSKLCLWSFLLFPYTLSEFLLERQLKKHKLGTLYPGMVEFRPIIKSNIDVKNIVYLDKDSNVVKVGDYISIGSNIKTSITVLDGYKISKASSTAFNNITIEKSNTDFIYDVIFYGIKKSPQKINLVIEQDSDYVQWNPNIKANVSKYSVTANIRKTDGTTLKLVNGQFYSTSITGNLVLDIVPPYKDSDEVTNVVIDGKSYVPIKDSSGNYYRLEIPLVFPKEINITIQEYVRYEDIVQPYPVLLRFKDENNNEISWGDKIKLGSSITRIGSFNDCNLLKDIYTVSNAKLNGNPLTSTPHVVERQMVFTCTATWIFDDNEPNCILSPRLLRIPNSSYKILRHIPDISGHGNHGAIYNSAYAEGSGVNEDGSYQFDGVDDFVTIPTLSKGGKQVLMKVNWSTLNGFIYDQRPASGDKTFGIYTQGYVIAYSQNNNGNTYIDGIINNNIIGSNLSKIAHNIVATCDVDNSVTPSIGKCSYSNSYFAQMSLYDFMLFDEISTDEEIKDLNDIVGIVSKVELPPYYWDTYGKTNTDADRDEIVNLANDEVSIQYPTDFTDISVWEDMGAVTSSTILTLTTWAMGGDTGIGNTIKAKVATPAMKVKFITDGNGYLDYMYSGYNTLELPRDAGEYEVELPASTIVDGWGARFSGSGNGNFTIELLGNEVRLGTLKVINSAYDEDSGYKNNGIALDGVDDSLVNTDIPAFTDYTYIFKRDILGFNPSSVSMHKGSSISNGRAFMSDYDYSYGETKKVLSYSFGNNLDTPDAVSKKIIYGTRTSVDGQPITPGGAVDDAGLTLGKWYDDSFKNMVFYKLMLYPKTIDILSINMLKNLFERDEIIDLNNPIFKK